MKQKKELVKLAQTAARLAAKAGIANRQWRDAFLEEFGHDDISDVLVEAIDYSVGDTSALTFEFIQKNSKPFHS
jgi:predicted chitinase